MKLDSLRTRIQELEFGLGFVELEDGTKFRPASGLRLIRMSLKLSRSLGRDAQLCDFSPADQEFFRIYAKWNPGPGFSQLSINVCVLARRMQQCE